jgi:hypothetical protein
MICPWDSTDFSTLCKRQNKNLESYENAITNFLSEVGNQETPTDIVLYWQKKFSDAMNYESSYGDEYVRKERKLRKVEEVIGEFIDEVRNCEDNYKMPKDVYSFVESMKLLRFMRHWQDKFYDSMDLPF